MKVVLLNSAKTQKDILDFGKETYENFKDKYDVVEYVNYASDFSDVRELFDSQEKLLMFNHFSVEGMFETLSKHLHGFNNVKYILSTYSSYAGLDLDLLKQLGIRYRNNGGANAKAVAQLALNHMFMLLTRVNLLSKDKASGLGEEFHGKTASVIGMGNIGEEIAKSLTGLGIKTNYYNRSKKNVPYELVDYDDVFNSDLIFISIATTKETKELLKDLHKKLKPHNYLIDITAIDELYDKHAVLEKLKDEGIKGYGIEFFDEVPESFDVDANVVATPHIAWATIEAERRTIEWYFGNAIKILEGRVQEIDFIV
ncbi:MAG: NAD(P)-dependent oxidoreductase [Candidatus Dojkabacteria bacterium]